MSFGNGNIASNGHSEISKISVLGAIGLTASALAFLVRAASAPARTLVRAVSGLWVLEMPTPSFTRSPALALADSPLVPEAIASTGSFFFCSKDWHLQIQLPALYLRSFGVATQQIRLGYNAIQSGKHQTW